MAHTEYTKTEREAINTAWAHLIDFAERSRMTDKLQIETALKDERREVSSPTVAKALLLRTLAESCDVDAACAVTSLADLWTLRGAHRDMVAYAHHYKAGLVEARVIYLARQAANAHEKAQRRAFEAIR